ncbi:MAG: MlaD family protein [Pseudomonadota bacterium]
MNTPETPKSPTVIDPKPGLRSSLSIVWLVPTLAVLAVLALAWQSYTNRDVLLTIEFPSAKGIEVGKTVLKYRDFEVGSVTGLSYKDDLSGVFVTAGIDKDMAKFLDADTEFWLTTAQVSARGLTGLDTLLSGAFISVEWDAEPGDPERDFKAQTLAPIIAPGSKGIEITLTAPASGSVSEGAPVLHKGVKMGTIEAVKYDPASDTVLITAFIDEPNVNLVNTATRFWNASGIQLNLGEGGIGLQIDSLSTLLQGGVAFDTTLSGGSPVANKAVFNLYETEGAARESLLDENLRATVHVSSAFEGSVKGLKEGSAVLFRGLEVGKVEDLSAITTTNRAGNPDIRLVASYTIQPARLGLEDTTTPDDTLNLLTVLVAQSGLRARLGVNSLLSGGLHIELYNDAAAAPAILDRSQTPYPVLPSTPTPPDTLATGAQDMLERVAALPIEQVMDRVVNVLADVDGLLSDPSTKGLPTSVNTLIRTVDGVVGSDDIQELPNEIRRVVADIKDILDQVDQSDAVAQVVAALKDVRSAADNIAKASIAFPVLMDTLNGLPLTDTVSDVKQVLDDLDAILVDPNTKAIPAAIQDVLVNVNGLVNSGDVKAMPGNVRAVVLDVKDILDQFAQSGSVEQVVASLKDVRTAVGNISTASDGVPKLVSDIDTLIEKADRLPLNDVVSSADAVLQSANAFISNPDMEKVPGAMSGALVQVNMTLDALREGGAVNNLNQTLSSATSAANAIAVAAAELPDLAKRLDQLANTADATLAVYGKGSAVNREIINVIEDLRDAVSSINSLVREIRRKPNSLLVGR